MTPWSLHQAVWRLRRGGLVLHATEGVWGLACDPFDPNAVDALLRLKGRGAHKGLIVVAAEAADFAPELDALAPDQRTRVEATWPGPVTWIVPSRRFPPWITGGRETVALRVPGHDGCRALCRAFGGPLVSTSANRSGARPARNHWQALAWLRGLRRGGVPAARLPFLLPGETAGRRRPSDIMTLDGSHRERRQ